MNKKMNKKNKKVPKQIYISVERLEELKKEANSRSMNVNALICSKLFLFKK